MKLFVLIVLLVATLSTAHGAPEALTSGVEPGFNRDGSLLAYARISRGERDIFMVDDDGREVQITSDIYWDGEPTFTPGGRDVIFISDRSGSRELWKIDLATDEISMLTSGSEWKSDPSVGPTGDVAFIMGRYPHQDLYVLSGKEVMRLTYLEEELYSPVWSPDGESIAFVKGEDLMTLDLRSGSLTQLASEVYHRGLSWTPEGELLYLKRGLGYDLWSMEAEENGAKRIIYEGVLDSWEVDPAISMRGDIAFSTDKDGFYKIYIIRASMEAARIDEPPALPAPSAIVAPEPIPSEIESPQPQSYEDSHTQLQDSGEDTADESISHKEDEISIGNPTARDDGIPTPQEPTPRDEINLEGILFLALSTLALITFLMERLKNREPQFTL